MARGVGTRFDDGFAPWFSLTKPRDKKLLHRPAEAPSRPVKETTRQDATASLPAAAPSSGWNWKWFAPLDADAGTAIRATWTIAPEKGCNGAIPRTQAGLGTTFGKAGPRAAGRCVRMEI